MRGVILAGAIGLVTFLPEIAFAERPLATSGVLAATAPNGTLCRSSVPITVRGPDAAAFTADPAPIEKLVAAIRMAIGFECQGKPSPQRLVLTGKAKGVIAYQAVAEADNQWLLVPDDAAQDSPSIPSKPAASVAAGPTSDTDVSAGEHSAQANPDEETPLPDTASDDSSGATIETPQKNPADASASRKPLYEAVNCATARPGVGRVICSDRTLVAMDKKLATTLAELANGPNPPPELGSDQENWIAIRDRCPASPVYCLRDAYEDRLAELALQAPGDVSSSFLSPDDGVTAESVRVAKRWGVPMLQGIPYLPRANEVKGQIGSDTFVRLAIPEAIRSGLGAQHIGNFDSLAAGIKQAAPVVRAWTRMMYAAGLASSSDALSSLDDNFFASLACVFLEPAAVKASPGGELCDYSPSRSQAEEAFDVHDLAESFRKDGLPRIIETAPHLPFRFLVVLPASIRPYDLEKKQFAVWAGYGDEFELSVLGSDVERLKQIYWPTPEADARKFISSHKGQSTIQSYLAIPLTIVGVTKQKVDSTNGMTWLNGKSGLLGFDTWTVQAGPMSLFADSGLHKQLYAFEADRPAGPKPEAAPLLNPEEDQ